MSAIKYQAALKKALSEFDGEEMDPVFAWPVGSIARPAIAIVGDHPRQDDNEETFSGDAGRVLKKALLEAGFRKGQVYMTNIVKFPPFLFTGRYRRLKWGTLDRFRIPLIEELAAVNAKVVLALGSKVAGCLLQDHDSKVSELRGAQYAASGVDAPIICAAHPEYVLHTGGMDRSEAFPHLVDDLIFAYDVMRKE